MSVQESALTTGELEVRLYRYMRIPVASLLSKECDSGRLAAGQDEPVWSQARERGNINRLRQAIWELQQGAAKIGRIPSGYPRHIDLVMRVVSALLPWYTRNLVQFGQRTNETIQVMAEVLEEVLRTQRLLVAERDGRRDMDMLAHDRSPEGCEPIAHS